MPLVAGFGINRASRERFLAAASGVPTDAVACSLQAARPHEALEMVELGRGVMWAQVLAVRADIAVLRQVAPALAGRLDAVRAQLG